MKQLEKGGLEVALINIDGWLNLPETRFSRVNPAEHFYVNAIRFDDLFRDLVLPLRDHRSIRLETNFVEEKAYRTIFPAQEIHLRRDNPLKAATGVIDNEAHLA